MLNQQRRRRRRGPTSSSTVKQRLTAVDVRALASELSLQLVGQRLTNIYDLTQPNTFQLNFGSSHWLLCEMGLRLHLTQTVRSKPPGPGSFVSKIRKHIRSWRLFRVWAPGVDRVIYFQFGSEDNPKRMVLIVELYGLGNLILADSQGIIKALLKSTTHRSEDDSVVQLMVGTLYPSWTSPSRAFQPWWRRISKEGNREEVVNAWMVQSLHVSEHSQGDEPSVQTQQSGTSRECLDFLMPHVNKALAARVIYASGFPSQTSGELNQTHFSRLAEFCDLIDSVLSGERENTGGLVIYDVLSDSEMTTGDQKDRREPREYWPGALEPLISASLKLPSNQLEVTGTFSEAMEVCFRSGEDRVLKDEQMKRETLVEGRRERFMRDHQRRIDGLAREELHERTLGQIIEQNAEQVDEARALVNDVLQTGTPWDVIRALMKRHKREKTHHVAALVHSLPLEEGAIDLSLIDASGEMQIVRIYLGLTALANTRTHYSKAKAYALKRAKTEAATERATASAEAKSRRVLEAQQKKKQNVIVSQPKQFRRSPFWFEKFRWFLSRHHLAIVSGFDAMQCDILIRRHMKESDIFVHSDIAGSWPCLILVSPGLEFSEALEMAKKEAAVMCLARSSAWQQQCVSTWWVSGTDVIPCPKNNTSNQQPPKETQKARQQSNISREPQKPYVLVGEKHYMEPLRPSELQVCATLVVCQSPNKPIENIANHLEQTSSDERFLLTQLTLVPRPTNPLPTIAWITFAPRITVEEHASLAVEVVSGNEKKSVTARALLELLKSAVMQQSNRDKSSTTTTQISTPSANDWSFVLCPELVQSVNLQAIIQQHPASLRTLQQTPAFLSKEGAGGRGATSGKQQKLVQFVRRLPDGSFVNPAGNVNEISYTSEEWARMSNRQRSAIQKQAKIREREAKLRAEKAAIRAAKRAAHQTN